MSYAQLMARLKTLAGPWPMETPGDEEEFVRLLPQLYLEGEFFRRLNRDKATACLVLNYGLCGHPRLSVSAIAAREGVPPAAVARLIDCVLEIVARALSSRAWMAEILDVDADGRPNPARAESIRKFCGLPPAGRGGASGKVIPLFRDGGPQRNESKR